MKQDSTLLDECDHLIEAANAILKTNWATHNATGIDEVDVVDRLTHQVEVTTRAWKLAKEQRQPVVVLLEDQGEIVDVVGPFDTRGRALAWSVFQKTNDIAPVGMKFLVQNVSDPGPGADMPTHQVVDFGLGPVDQTQGYPFEGSEAECSRYVEDHQETRTDNEPRFAIQPIPEDEGQDSDQFAISKEEMRRQGLDMDLAERNRQEDQPPAGLDDEIPY